MTTNLLSPTNLVDHEGKDVDSFLRAGRFTIVYFMRTADCPACRKHVGDLLAAAPDFDTHQTDIVVVVPDGVDAAAELHKHLSLTFPVLTSATFHDAVGLQEKVFGKIRQSGVFLIDDTGKVLYQHAATLPPLSMKMSALTAAVHSQTA